MTCCFASWTAGPPLPPWLLGIERSVRLITMRCDYLAANQLGRVLYSPLFESREQPPNSARFTFLDLGDLINLPLSRRSDNGRHGAFPASVPRG